MRWISIRLLEGAERFFLRTHGWKRKKLYWAPPADYPFRRKEYQTRRHAVNAHRQAIYNPMHGGTRSEQPG